MDWGEDLKQTAGTAVATCVAVDGPYWIDSLKKLKLQHGVGMEIPSF